MVNWLVYLWMKLLLNKTLKEAGCCTVLHQMEMFSKYQILNKF